jgi:heme O synthase-like polyprenyltransferase
MKRSDNLAEKKICGRIGATAAMFVLMAAPAFAATDWTSVVSPIVSFLNTILGPLIAIVAAVGALYCVLLGVKFAKAEEPQDREKAKTHLKNAIIGFVLIFVLIVVLRLAMPQLFKWVQDSTGTSVGTVVTGN